MIFLRLLPVLISFLLMAAHFVRAGQMEIAFALLALLLILILRKAWVPWIIQLVLLLGALEWVLTLIAVAQMRIKFELPWIRMAIILGAVALFTVLSCLVFRSDALRTRYSDERNTKIE